MTIDEAALAAGRNKILATFGSREGAISHMLMLLSASGQPTDVCFFPQTGRKPLFDVTVSPELNRLLMYGAGVKRVQQCLNAIEFSDGTVAPLPAIWGLMPMPEGGVSQAELDAVDLSDGEQKAGENGETVRQILTEQYQCTTPIEVERNPAAMAGVMMLPTTGGAVEELRG